jgi:hypothetical protein
MIRIKILTIICQWITNRKSRLLIILLQNKITPKLTIISKIQNNHYIRLKL